MHNVRRHEKEIEELHGIRVKKKPIKCVGIYVCHDKEECYNKNWMRIYHNMKKNYLNPGNVENQH